MSFISELGGPQVVTAVSALVYTSLICYAGIAGGGSKIDIAKSIILFALGASLGWLVAGLISPHSVTEKEILKLQAKQFPPLSLATFLVK